MNETTPHLSIFKSARAIVPEKTVTVTEAVDLIRSDRLKADIERLRDFLSAGNRAAYDQGKKDLPAVTWSGTFKARNKAGLVDPSGLVVIDLDHIGDRMPTVRDVLKSDPAVVACFTSPSGDGLKAVAAVSDSSDHGRAWRAVADRVKAETGIEPDQSGKDVSRLCFLSHDPNAYHNPAPVPVVIPPEPSKSEPPRAPAVSNSTRANNYARGALEKAVAAVVRAVDGSRNQSLNNEAYTIGQLIAGGVLDESEASEALRRAAIGAGLSEEETRKTIESGIKAGKAKPRTVPEPKTETAGADALEWKEPKPIKGELAPVPTFDPATLLPEALRDWIMDEADRMPCPPDYIAAAAVVELGAVIGARCAMKPKKNDDWLVVPNLWGGVVGHPTSKKTPAINAAFKPLDRLSAMAREEYDKAMKEYQGREMKHEALKEAYEAQIKAAAKKSVKPRDADKGADSGELDGFISEYQKSFELQDLAQPAMRRYKTNDGSIEKIGEILRDNPAGLLVLRDELVGLLASWERAGHEEDRAFYLEAWNGMNSHDVDRIGRGSIRVPNLCLSIFGGIQPDKLIGYLEEAASALANDGMLQRFQILVYPDHRRWEWRDRRPRHDARERVFKMFDTLGYFTPEDWGATPANEHVKIPCFHLEQEAQDVFIEWSRELNQERIPAESSMLLAQHIGKYEKLFAALSLIFHLVDCVTAGARGPVSRACAIRAAAWCEYLEAHARRCYGLLQDGGFRAAQALSEKIEAGELAEGFTARDVLRNQWRYLTTDEAVTAALEWLEDEGWVKGIPTGGTGPGSGRKTLRYIVNPKARREGRNV